MVELNALNEVGWLSVWLLGLSVGLTTCTAVCMPYLGTWAIGQGQGGAAAAWDTGRFASGKIAAYAVLGGGAGLLGSTVTVWLNDGVGHIMIGLASVFAGLWLLRPHSPQRGCAARRRTQGLSPFAMGFALSFTPCAPLAALLAASASAGDAPLGAFYGFLFGLGAALTPLFIVIPLLGKFGQSLRDGRPWLSLWLPRIGGLVLIAIGLNRLWMAF